MLLFLAAALSAPTCPVERARYSLRTNPTVTAAFHPTRVNDDWQGGTTLRIHIGITGHDYWWLPWDGGTDDMRHVRLTRRVGDVKPVGDFRLGYDEDFWTTDAAYNMTAAVPKIGDPAPGHFLMPTLGRDLYYGTVQTEAHGKDGFARGFFDLLSCDAPNPKVDVELPGIA
jgi:hypothetical protein